MSNCKKELPARVYDVISLADESGEMVKPWAEAGYFCACIDIQHSIRRVRREGNIDYVWGDLRSWSPIRPPKILFAFTPCTHLAVSGARDFNQKSWPMLRDGMDLFYQAIFAAQWAGVPYMLENPVGRISGLYAPAEFYFHPSGFAGLLEDPSEEAYTKKNLPLARERVCSSRVETS
ncbi:hypothetical protein [Thalassoglobus neptunius]|uniref:hypothetical protein n=1 Tax=Thalassoglobus neptunius TaxID=1938619 RepID=UPI0011B47E1A|nr:hypothetical protein [Thalassoglobus neptunius]